MELYLSKLFSSKTNSLKVEGYEGFCIDLLDKLSDILGFEYELSIVRDAKYGRPKENSTEWDGMIGEILSGVGCLEIIVSAVSLELHKRYTNTCTCTKCLFFLFLHCYINACIHISYLPCLITVFLETKKKKIKNADMAVAPITVTARRLEVVDFTDPFLQLGISMLMRTPDNKATASITSFMWPLSPR